MIDRLRDLPAGKLPEMIEQLHLNSPLFCERACQVAEIWELFSRTECELQSASRSQRVPSLASRDYKYAEGVVRTPTETRTMRSLLSTLQSLENIQHLINFRSTRKAREVWAMVIAREYSHGLKDPDERTMYKIEDRFAMLNAMRPYILNSDKRDDFFTTIIRDACLDESFQLSNRIDLVSSAVLKITNPQLRLGAATLVQLVLQGHRSAVEGLC